MPSRRDVIIGAATLPIIMSSAARAQDACAVLTEEQQRSTAPDAAIARLKAGNERFVAGRTVNCDMLAQVKASAPHQTPFAAVLGCIDSRVPPELVFDQRIGAIFSARVAGNFVNTDMLGSLEFACKLAGAKAIVVLGHSECGAIKGAVDKAKLGNLTAMLRNFDAAVAATRIAGERSSKNKKLVQAVAETHAKLTAKLILARSPVLREMAAKKEIVIAAAMHDLATGRITFLS